MCKGPCFASSKKMEGLILFHEGFSSLRILWTPLCSNANTKGYIWDNIWCLKFFCKCCTNSCCPANVGHLCFLTHYIIRLHSTCNLLYNLVGVINRYFVFFLPYHNVRPNRSPLSVLVRVRKWISHSFNIAPSYPLRKNSLPFSSIRTHQFIP